MDDSLFITQIQRYSLHDGPGIRTTVFLKGCNLSCRWCHNPETQKSGPQIQYLPKRCIQCGACLQACPEKALYIEEGHIKRNAGKCAVCGACATVCYPDATKVIGEKLALPALMETLEADRDLYEDGGGVTFSGGEPMLQAGVLSRFLPKIREAGIPVTVDTAGCVPFDWFELLLPEVDLFLYDIKMTDPLKHKDFTGVSNELILDNAARLSRAGSRLWIRTPLMHGVNDTEEDLNGLHRFLEGLSGVERLDLLPYHAYGNYKAEGIGLPSRTFQTPSDEQMRRIQEYFSDIADAVSIM